jgi:hypothetical protein
MKFLFFLSSSALLAVSFNAFHAIVVGNGCDDVSDPLCVHRGVVAMAADCPDKGSRKCFPADTVGGAVEAVEAVEGDDNYRGTGR